MEYRAHSLPLRSLARFLPILLTLLVGLSGMGGLGVWSLACSQYEVFLVIHQYTSMGKGKGYSEGNVNFGALDIEAPQSCALQQGSP